MADLYIGEETKLHRRAVKRKRLRRLIDYDPDTPDEGRKRYRRDVSKAQIHKVEFCSKRVFITCLLISVSVALLLGNQNGSIGSFIHSYREHFNQIVHGNQNYCVENLDSVALSKSIEMEETVLNQNKALQELRWTLDLTFKGSRCTYIALVGPVGVGKTLYVNALQQHFPWQENVHVFVWDTHLPDVNEKFRRVRMLIESFSECGINLLIIKNLKPYDKPLVNIVAEMIKEQSNSTKTRSIVFFVFNLNTMLSDVDYSEQYHSLQDLNFTRTINFKEFGKKELEDCIRHECKRENVELSHDTIKELLETIDVKHSGCKNVYAKVLAYGKRVKKS